VKIRSCLTPLILPSCLLAFTLPSADGGSATWDLNPATGVWNTPANWTPETVPHLPPDVATFSVSNVTDITIKSSVEVGAVDFTAGASPFTVSAIPGVTLTISGAGVSNASGIGQNFATSDNSNGAGTIVFMGSATAGDGNTYTNNAHSNAIHGVAATEFFGTSNAGTSTITNTNPGESFHAGGFTGFFDQSSAANSTIINEVPARGDVLDAFPSNTFFADNSTAGNAILIAQGSPHASGDTWSEIDFYDQSTADHATITLEGGGPVSGGVAGTIYSLITLRRAQRQRDYQPVFEDWLFHAILPLLAYGTLLGAALALVARTEVALFAIAAVALLLLSIGIHNSWDTVTYIVLDRSNVPRKEPTPGSGERSAQ